MKNTADTSAPMANLNATPKGENKESPAVQSIPAKRELGIADGPSLPSDGLKILKDKDQNQPNGQGISPNENKQMAKAVEVQINKPVTKGKDIVCATQSPVPAVKFPRKKSGTREVRSEGCGSCP